MQYEYFYWKDNIYFKINQTIKRRKKPSKCSLYSSAFSTLIYRYNKKHYTCIDIGRPQTYIGFLSQLTKSAFVYDSDARYANLFGWDVFMRIFGQPCAKQRDEIHTKSAATYMFVLFYEDWNLLLR